jgi:DNA ligase-associated metallophosphoesterase
MPAAELEHAIRIAVAGQHLSLYPSGVAYWEEAKTLFAADFHLGKETSFRRGGIPIPAGATERTVNRLLDCMDQLDPCRVIILGDFVHAGCSWDDRLRSGIARILQRLEDRPLMLIEGNHDRGSRKYFAEFPIQLISPPKILAPWILLHDESRERTGKVEEDHCFLAGHLHPAISLGHSTMDRTRVKCFCLANRCLTLPAFGEFTGAKRIQRQPNQEVYAIIEDRIARL